MDKRVLEIKQLAPMVPMRVYKYLTALGKNWSGRGDVVELGAWLGAATCHLLRGLKEAGFNKNYFVYDRWYPKEAEIRKAKNYFGLDLKVGQDLLPMFLENVGNDVVTPIKGNMMNKLMEGWKGDNIEICIFDAPKKDPLFSACIRELAPYWIPRVTVIGFLDYYQYRKYPYRKAVDLMAPVRLVDRNPESFHPLKDFGDICSCRFFRYKNRLENVDRC